MLGLVLGIFLYIPMVLIIGISAGMSVVGFACYGLANSREKKIESATWFAQGLIVIPATFSLYSWIVISL